MRGGIRTSFRLTATLLAAAIALSACSRDRDPKLVNFGSNADGPDEFAILPTKPLEMPQDFAALPAPNPGGANRVDVQPEAEAYAALGGNAAALNRPRDGGLVTYVGRYGIAPDIRPALAAADLEFRRANDGRLLERLFNVNIYFKSYRPQALDQHAELERFRRAGIRTSAAPPEPAE